jgi:hypothetical protein
MKPIRKILKVTLLVLCLFCLTFNYAHAEKGDFYKKHKDTIEKQVLIKQHKELIKKYDYEKNHFECGLFDVLCFIEGVQFKMAIGAVKLTYGGLDNFVISPSKITENKVFKQYKNGLSTLSTTMMGIFLMWQMVKIIAQRYADSEDGMIAINQKLLMVVTSAILLGLYDEFSVWVLKIQESLVSAVLRDSFNLEDVVLITFINGSQYGMIVAFMIMLVMLVFVIAFMYRFVLFGFLYVVGVIAIPTSVNDEYNYFSVWLRTLINNGVTLFLQAIVFTLGFQALVKNNAFSMGASFTVGIAFFILALTIPSLLGQLGASTGTGRAIGSVVRYLANRR